MSIVAAWLACALLGALALFQAALIAGAPIGRFAWGGQHRVLPRGFRIGSVVAIVLYVLFALIILQRALVLPSLPEPLVSVGVWVVLTYFILGIGMNAISRSKPERYTTVPVTIVLTVLSFFIAMGYGELAMAI